RLASSSLIPFSRAMVRTRPHQRSVSTGPGVYGIHRDAVRGQFLGDGQRKIDPGSVRSPRCGFEVNRLDAIIANDIDDTPPAAFLHVRDSRFSRTDVAHKF